MTRPLFTQTELADHLGKPVSEAAAASRERVVWGWLKPVLGIDERPDPIPDELFSWAVELGAIAHENPSGLTRYQLGTEQLEYSAERRAEILASAGTSEISGASTGGPHGSFPPARRYPDAAECW